MNGDKIFKGIVVLALMLASFLAAYALNENRIETQKEALKKQREMINRLSRVVTGMGRRIIYFKEKDSVYILMVNYAGSREEARSASIYFKREKLLVLPSEVIDDNVPLFKVDYHKTGRDNIFYIGNKPVETDLP